MKNQFLSLGSLLFTACFFVACGNEGGGEVARKTVLADGWQVQSSEKEATRPAKCFRQTGR